ncbi:MAG: hypothetical protein BIFFINMI_04380 [Phycisphaerae bacterium]|nr:hypothetical protein [Phycisphaerae bacterium]
MAMLACTLLLLCAGCVDDDLDDLPAGMNQPSGSIVVTQTAWPPIIDGRLDDRAWQSAARVSDFVSQDGKPPGRRTQVRLTYDDTALYVAFTCDEPQLVNLVNSARQRDGAVEQDDSVQVYISPDLAGRSFKTFAVSCRNVQRDADQNGPAWNTDWPSAARIDADGWMVEMAIPLRALDARPRRGDTWRILLVRNIWTGTPQVASNVYVGASPWATEKYATLLFR